MPLGLESGAKGQFCSLHFSQTLASSAVLESVKVPGCAKMSTTLVLRPIQDQI